jgi:hypothetical protein
LKKGILNDKVCEHGSGGGSGYPNVVFSGKKHNRNYSPRRWDERGKDRENRKGIKGGGGRR